MGKYGGALRGIDARVGGSAGAVGPDVEAWFRVINPSMKTHTLRGPCVRVLRNSYQRSWDLLLIEFGSGRKRWIRRQNLDLVTL